MGRLPYLHQRSLRQALGEVGSYVVSDTRLHKANSLERLETSFAEILAWH